MLSRQLCGGSVRVTCRSSSAEGFRAVALRTSALLEVSPASQVKKRMSGFVVWMTGLSGAGKSTLASLLTQELSSRGVHVECLDGDEVRKNLSHGLGFSREDRDRNVRRIGYVARMVARSGSCAITAAISPYRALRDEIRSRTENFLEVYCECPLDVLTERDPKGLYKRALAGEIKNFTGVDDPYEAPEDPEVLLRTDKTSPEQCVQQIIAVLEEKGLLAAPTMAPAMLPPPFGGEVFDAREATLGELAAGNMDVAVSAELSQNIMAVASGYFSPVSGFMSEREVVKVTKGGALEGGTPWWDRPFVLPLPASAEEPAEGAVLRITSQGTPVALARVDRVWELGGERYVAGPIEAIPHAGRVSPGARVIRRLARERGVRHMACVFPQSGPSPEVMRSLSVAQALTDGLVIAASAKHFAAWRDFAGGQFETISVIQVPDDFPADEPRARHVVERSVGASASLLLK